jgi:hypothetical protein
VQAGQPSEAFLFAGWARRSAWVRNDGPRKVTFSFQVDAAGKGQWQPLRAVAVEPGTARQIEFTEDQRGEWVRVVADGPTTATVHFSYTGPDARTTTPDARFRGLARVTGGQAMGGLLYGLGDNRRALGVSAVRFDGTEGRPVGYYELDARLQLRPRDDARTLAFINEKFAIPKDVVTIDSASVLVVDDGGRRWRLPLGAEGFTGLTRAGALRVAREVATERDLLHCVGTFYELPAENADGFAKIRPVASHPFRIHDYASYRGLLVMTGIDPAAGKDNPHVIVSEDGKAAVWAGVIDDLWKMGKPTGRGGPWKNTPVRAGEPSDPYLIGFYDRRKLSLSHGGKTPVTFRLEAEPVGHGPWMTYREITVAPGETYAYTFPPHFQARWIRFTADRATVATAWLTYE